MATARQGDCILHPEPAQAIEYQPPALDEPIDRNLGVAREGTECSHQLVPIDRVLRTDAIEIAADDHRSGQTGDQSAEIVSLVRGVAVRVGMVGRNAQAAHRSVDYRSEAAAIVDAQLAGSRDRMLAQDGVAPRAVIKLCGLMGKPNNPA